MAGDRTAYGLMMQKAERSLEAAGRLIAGQDYDFASSRAYYAVFYAVQAALRSRDFDSSKHSTAIAEFNRLFVKEGVFPKDYGGVINQLFRNRQIGDYSFSHRITESAARKDVEIARTIIAAIKDYLIKSGLLPVAEE